jgi:hypothetical protein
MQARTSWRWVACGAAAAGLVAACGGGGGDAAGEGTMRLSLTDAPACGYDHVYVTVDRVRVHQSSGAGENDAGWRDIALPAPRRVDLLELTNGTLEPLGQAQLPAGTYTQLRLVLAPNTASNPLANSIVPTGGTETALTTPSGQQSGLKLNVNLEVPADRIADFAIDFDACKSFVRAGNSGQYLLKPVLSVIPILSDAGQRIVGYVEPSLAATTTTVSAQVNGAPVRATPPDANGRFVLYPVPAGTYDLVITAPGRVNAVMTGVPVVTNAFTTIGSDTARIATPASAASAVASGTVTVNGSAANTGAAVRAQQLLTGGPTIEVGYSAADATTGVHAMTMPTGAPARIAYAAGAMSFAFSADAPVAGLYRLEANAPTFTPRTANIVLASDVTTNFAFP